MIEELKLLLGIAAENYTDAQIGLALKQALAIVEAYTKRQLDYELTLIAERIAIIQLNRMNTEGLSAINYSGVSESYIDGFPDDIKAILNSKRKIKVI